MLLTGRSPKVVLRNVAIADIVALRYLCVKSIDGVAGVCIIRKLPADREAIERFINRLPYGIE